MSNRVISSKHCADNTYPLKTRNSLRKIYKEVKEDMFDKSNGINLNKDEKTLICRLLNHC